jgi:simple sugar transport system permease protein
MEVAYRIIHSSFDAIIPLLIVALGGLVTERSGVTNIALDGIMLVGSFIGFIIITSLEQTMPIAQNQIILLMAILGAGIVGGLFSLLHAYSSITLKSDQIISATALNLFAPAMIAFILLTAFRGGDILIKHYTYKISAFPLLSRIPVIGDIFFQDVSIGLYLSLIILVIVYVFLYKTKFGMRLRACGENPHAADSLGIKIYKYRYLGVITSGVLAGIGGILFTLSNIGTFQSFNATAGYGFLALAVLIFGAWRPYRVLFAAAFFGFMSALSSSYTLIPFLSKMNIPSQVYNSLPYILTLIVLAISSKRTRAPMAVGKIYDQGAR